jgi:23S rRNA pseudouridine2605 synthase
LRLNRYISASGVSSRRKGEELIRDGRISVNGKVVTDPAKNVEPEMDTVTLDGLGLKINEKKRYYVLNKPLGVIVSRKDTHRRKTVIDLLGNETKGVFPVGRLDADTSGVLLLTDDGLFAYRLMHPSFGVEKVYRAEVEGTIDRDDIKKFGDGMILDDGPTAPAGLKIVETKQNVSIVEITIHQGRKRQVRRMLKLAGHAVKKLERISFGGITLQNLPRGKYRTLLEREIEQLKKSLNFED